MGTVAEANRRESARSTSRERGVDDSLRLAHDHLQMCGILETFRVDLVDVLGAGRPCGEPAAGRTHLDPADRRIVAGRTIEDLLDFFAGEFAELEIGRGKLAEPGALRRIRGRLDAIGEWFAEGQSWSEAPRPKRQKIA